MIKLIHGDCFDYFSTIADQSIDLVLCDPPYGTTACKWDSVLPLDEMWKELTRVTKKNAVIALFSAEPFTSLLISSKLNYFKYRLDWNKKIPSGMSYAKYRPMQQTEDICIFSISGEKTNYYPQMILRDKPIKSGGMGNSLSAATVGYKPLNKTYAYKNPITLIEFEKVRKGSFHPTQKPVELLEYLIKTYSLEGQTVLDFTMGSGSTGVACKNTNRNFIGIEKELEYYNIAKQRVLTEGNEQVTEDWFDSFLEG